MAFERPIEADRVEDLGLFSSFIRAPIVGTILWFLGGEDAKKAEEEDRRRGSIDEEENFRDYELKSGEGKRTVEIESWPQISSGESDLDINNIPSYEKIVTAEFSASEQSTNIRHEDSSGPASRVVNELVAVMDATSLDERERMRKRSPRKCSSKSNLASLDTAEGTEAIDTDTVRPSLSSTSNISSNSNIVKKKMSWSDEKGHQPLVEYYDEQIHSSRYRRNNWRPSRSCSFDSQDKLSSLNTRGRSQVRFIKSALKRSGSYSPPIQMCHSDSVCSTSSSNQSSKSEVKSFRSLSVIGSTDSDSNCDSLNETRNDPSVLQQMGCGSGALNIPHGMPGAYHLTLGTVVPVPTTKQSTSAEESTNLSPSKAGNTATSRTFHSITHSQNNRQSSRPHHFLPHHSNGYISPQYGFYVNITPPTPEMFYPRPPPGTFTDAKSSKTTVQQQSYQQFAKQKPFRPSPIPEITTVAHNENKKLPLQPMFQESTHVTPRDVGKKSLKRTFIKNKQMGMFLSDNPHQVFPTVPFG